MDKNTTIQELKEKVRMFCEKRDWDQYHNAKDLSIGIITESSELLEFFRFKNHPRFQEFKSRKRGVTWPFGNPNIDLSNI